MDDRRHELVCAACGYRVRIAAAPLSCPMCRASTWEHGGLPAIVPASALRRRVLVEHTDARAGAATARALHDAGYAVAACPGPMRDEPCPLLRGEDCPLARRACAIVSNVAAHPEGDEIRARLRARYPRTPLLVGVEPRDAVGAVTGLLAA
jgi:hypothetical protein